MAMKLPYITPPLALGLAHWLSRLSGPAFALGSNYLLAFDTDIFTALELLRTVTSPPAVALGRSQVPFSLMLALAAASWQEIALLLKLRAFAASFALRNNFAIFLLAGIYAFEVSPDIFAARSRR